MAEKDTVTEAAHKDDGFWTHNIYDGEMQKHKSLAAAKSHADDSEEESVIHHVSGGTVQKTHRMKADGDGWESHTQNKGKTLDHKDLHEASAADTLKPGGGSGGGDTKAETLATFTSLLAQLGKDDLSKLFNDVQSQFGPNKAPGAEDKSAANRATVAMKPSDAVGKGAWKEDIDEMFGDDLTEDFKERAEVVFEAAVNTRVNLETARLEEEFEAKAAELEEQFEDALEEQTAAVLEDVTSKLDQYLDYCVEQWMEDNKLAIENSLRADIAEDFMEALRNVFAEHYITVPDEKIDIVAEMKAELDEIKAKLNETVDAKIALEAIIEEATKEAAFEEVSEGLAETQVEKLKTLAEGIDYSDADTYRKKLEIVKEQYFKTSKPATTTGLITEEIDGEDDTASGTTGYTAPGMNAYVQAIAKAVK
ncbi:prohead core protein [uncultured Caudovirales phage]|uniref:Prohead core protein n=1 Tax=uncultured Caudovirales phage TaxID=2100421 RepID=A0A6J5M7W8_9CAUD|nr:prohead core protein [uncultured Caudovirales phage]